MWGLKTGHEMEEEARQEAKTRDFVAASFAERDRNSFENKKYKTETKKKGFSAEENREKQQRLL